MKIAVTGTTGFIGRHLVRKLSESNDVYCVIRRAIPGEKNIYWHDLQNVNEKFDVLYHLAAARHGWGVSAEQYNQNVDLTKRIIDFAVRGCSHFILVSSVAVYGIQRGVITEENPHKPETFYSKGYAISKQRCEDLTLDACSKAGIPYTILRPSTVYGPDDTVGMIYKMLTMIDKGRFAIIGDGSSVIHLVYVSDVVNGLMLALNKSSYNGHFNLCGERPYSLSDIVDSFCDRIGHRNILHVPIWFTKIAALLLENAYKAGVKITGKEPLVTFERIGMMTASQVYSTEKAREVLGYSPKICLEEGLGRVYEAYKE